MRTIRAEPLTPRAFAPFGQVLQTPGTGDANANQGTAVRLDRVARLLNTRGAACAPNLAMIRSLPQPLPLKLRLLERHPCSSQAFIPLACSRYLVVVAPTSDERPDWANLRAFIAKPGQGINYAAGTWHHPFTALDAPADLAMLAWEDGTPRDCEEVPLPEDITVTA
jgi:ureidoglycolate lyase